MKPPVSDRRHCRRPLQPLLLFLLLLAGDRAIADARTDYLLHCGGCHLEDGSGDPPEVPSLRVNVDRFAAVSDGRAYLSQVPGAAQVPISDARLAAVLNWVLITYYPGRSFKQFSAVEVEQYRGTTLLNPLDTRQRLLRSLDEP